MTIKGNTASPQNVVLSRANADALTVRSGALRLEALTLQTSGTYGNAILAELGAVVTLGPGLIFGTCINNHVFAQSRSLVRFESGAAITIIGGAVNHLASYSAQIEASSTTWTLTGTPAFANFALATRTGVINLYLPTFNGTATGARYSAQLNAVIHTYTGNTALLPGSTSGAVSAGGIYG